MSVLILLYLANGYRLTWTRWPTTDMYLVLWLTFTWPLALIAERTNR